MPSFKASRANWVWLSDYSKSGYTKVTVWNRDVEMFDLSIFKLKKLRKWLDYIIPRLEENKKVEAQLIKMYKKKI